jgi:hypothetical protein
VSHRPLVVASGLTIGDYLLWNWSLNTNHDVLALVSGLTLPLLVFLSAWLLTVSLARLIARSARLPAARRSRARLRSPAVATAPPTGGASATAGLMDPTPPSASSDSPPRKLAA